MTLDTEALLAELSPQPCGENLEYDPDFIAMEKAAEGTPERVIGDHKIEAEEADWRQVLAFASKVASRTRDLRVAWYLTRAGLLQGFPGLVEGLQLTHGLLSRHWEQVHPQLDPDDGNDPTSRVNTIARLCSPDALLRPLQLIPVVESRAVGRFCHKDFEIAEGRATPPAGESPATLGAIEAAYADLRDNGGADTLHTTRATLETAITLAGQIDGTLTERVGAGKAVDLSPLVSTLRGILSNHEQMMRRTRLLDGTVDAGGAVSPSDPSTSGGSAGTTGQTAGAAGSDEIRTREDVVRMIDRICAWYRSAEPSSPVPMLLHRARRLVHKDFIEILQDLTPEGVRQAQFFRGDQDDA